MKPETVQSKMVSPLVTRGAVVVGTAMGVALADRDRRDSVRAVTNGAVRFGRAFGHATIISLDFKYRWISCALGIVERDRFD